MAETPSAITLIFSNPQGDTLKRGPFYSFCLQGETLREQTGGATVAVHENHKWEIGGRKFVRIDCDCCVRVHLSRVDGKKSKDYGPFESFSCMDGIAYANHEIFAFADRSIGDWYCHADGLHWAIITVEAAS